MRFNHDWLFKHVCRKLPEDYEGYGETPRERYDMWGGDCSMGCKWAWWLGEDMGHTGDWCICINPKSHRCGMLTFEHQGCWQYEHSRSEPKMRAYTAKEREAWERRIGRRIAKLERGQPS